LEFGTETGEFRWVIDHDDSGSYIIKFFLDDGGDTIAERELKKELEQPLDKCVKYEDLEW